LDRPILEIGVGRPEQALADYAIAPLMEASPGCSATFDFAAGVRVDE
jgi:hypothetical protein